MNTAIANNTKQFKVGQLVMITRRGTDYDANGMGSQAPWMNVWNDEMNYYIGKVMRVAELPEGMFENEGIALEDCLYTFPANVLAALNQGE
jgi:hypothetical protein